MIVCTGYYDHPKSDEVFWFWLENTRKATDAPIYVISANAAPPDYADEGVAWIRLGANLGHVKFNTQKGKLGGWSHSFLMGCLLAYGSDTDLLYKESDCFAFGPWLDRLKNDMGAAGLVTGKANVGGEADGLQEQSLVYVRHWYLLEFVERFMFIGESDIEMDTESKFKRIGQENGKHAVTTMGYGRTRPFNIDDEAFFVQQTTPEDLAALQARGLT